MSTVRIMAIVLRQFYLVRGSLTRVLPLFIWVAIDVVLWGFITTYLNSFTRAGYNFVPSLLGAVLLWDFLVRVMQGVTMAFLEDVWSRNFLNIFASPLTIPEYLAGLVISSICTSLVGLAVMLLLATTVFHLSFLSYGILFAPALLILFLFGIALGIVGCAIVLRFGPASEWFVWPIPAIISPFVGVFYPLATLPHWMQWIAHLLAPSYVFEALRAIIAHEPVPANVLVIAAGLAIACILLACLAFKLVFRHALKTGLIARYSAETVG